MIILFNVTALFLLGLIIWWFWLSKEKAQTNDNEVITIEVKDGVYSPSRVQISKTHVTLRFIRKDASPCAEFVVFDTLDIHEQLPLNKSHSISLQNLSKGEYKFSCQMNMYQGSLLVNIYDQMKGTSDAVRQG